MDLDPHGQPYALGYNQQRRTTRDVCELLGLAKGMLIDGVVSDDEAERVDLQGLLASLVGGKVTTELAECGATVTPFDDPPPAIEWLGQLFVLTGQFAYAERTICAREVERRGGACTDNITRRTNYLVIGTFMSRDWKFGSFGTKIEKAVSYRSRGVPIRIVGEDHWAKHL